MLRVRVLGDLTVELDGTAAALPSSAKVRAVLGWLALHPGMRSRATVAARLWPDVLDTSARASLRSAIWALRRALGDDDGRLLVTTREQVGLGGAVWVDLAELDRLARAGRADEALALDQGGELLADLDDDWVLAARDEHRERRMATLAAAATAAEARGDLAAAIAHDRRRIQLDPLSEPAHRDAIRRLGLTGDRGAALATYARLRDRLRRDLALSPSEATRALVAGLRAEPHEATPAEPRDRTAGLPALVGREAELGVLGAAWRRAAGGGGGAVLLEGEGGIGKTRLALELLGIAEADGAAVAACAGLELGGSAPFGLWAELLGALARGNRLAPPDDDAAWPEDIGRLTPAAATRLRGGAPHRPALPASPELERARLFEAVVEMIGWAAAQRPLALLIEDLQLADSASLELAAYLARRLPELPVLLILTRRDTARRPAADLLRAALARRAALHAEIQLAPLDDPTLARLVRAVADLPGDAIDRVVDGSEGNPLLAIEAARAAETGAAPAGLRALVRVATAGLDPDARALSELIAVAARELAHEEVAALPVAHPAAAAAGALESGLLHAPDGRLGFRHAMLRAAAYDDLPEPRRAELHDQLAQALEAAGCAPAAELARHLRLAGRDDAAARHLERAGMEARGLGALAEAASFLGEALEIRPGDPSLWLELGDVESWRSDWDAAEDAFARALAALPAADRRARARTYARRGLWFRTSLCAPERSATAYREALALLEPEADQDALLIEVLAGLAWSEGAGGDPAEADALLRRIHEFTGGHLPDAAAATVNAARGMALCRTGRFAESYGPMVAAAEAHLRAGALDEACVALSNAGCAAAFEHDFERALGYADRAARIGSGVIQLELHVLAGRAYVLSRLGRHAEARAAAELQVARAEEGGLAAERSTAQHDRGQVALAAGDLETAVAALTDALHGGDRFPRASGRLARAEALARLGRADAAEAELRAAALEPVTPADAPAALVARMTRVQGLVAAGRGDRAGAALLLGEAAAAWRRQLAAGERGAYRVDLGRPPVAGLVEPDRELARVERELAALDGVAV